ncbi:CBS domain-containing protein [Desulfonatronovibrio magnus]|uniref:CBS domain-containing protein n=1 Tax=Desulfonatronovibrio magnus TaxID=698827 RepID=UPI0005EBC309|nr:CBS domain-containing protein [Desulfonatronovibrio magnus]
MKIITTHYNTDFDALASMVAASFLYPDHTRVMPTQACPMVREFLTVHWDMLRLVSRKNIDLSELTHLVVTDTSSWQRLDKMQELAENKNLQIEIWDHHMGQSGIKAGSMRKEETGAAVTIVLEEIQKKDLAFSPVHATLFLLGIYEDTGSLSFPGTTHRDARMAAFMLENGADLNVVSAYLEASLDSRHLELFSRMLADSDIVTAGSLRIGICTQQVDKGLNMLPSVVNKFKDIKGLDAAFGIFPMNAGKTAVIGRGSARALDIGALMRKLGGGGHPGAGSAILKTEIQQAREELTEIISSTEIIELKVRQLTTQTNSVLYSSDTLEKAAQVLNESGRSTIPVIDENSILLGMINKKPIDKIKNQKQWQQPVTSMLNRNFQAVSPDQSVRQALEIMAGSDAGFLPVIEDSVLTGEITRSSIILYMYEF